MMQLLSLADVHLSAPLALRAKAEIETALALFATGGVTLQAPEEAYYALPDGRLRIVFAISPGFSVVVHGEREEWRRVSVN
jgi:hypothetical protein